uniref:glucuronosyltransferase n=1 Tax=Panagrellus redivivus TaxID=6233 RepID=A0A7E4ZX38_PANRE
MHLSTFLGVVVVVFCTFGHAANVVVINPYVSHSHFAFLVKLTVILADEGHKMTMIVNELDTSKFAPLPKKARVIIRSKFSSNPIIISVGHARFTFLNTEEHMDFPRPISHKVIYVGVITVSNSSADDLPEDYKQIFDSSKKGAVLVSFGSVAKSETMPSKLKESFLDMFAAFPEISFI